MSPLRRSDPLSRKTPLRSKTPLTGSTPAMRASRLTRSTLSRRLPKVATEERNARRLVTQRANGKAECCGQVGPVDWSHRISRARGGQWCPANGIALCRIHHAFAHAQPRAAYDLGWFVRTNDDPATVPAWLIEHGWCLLNPDGTVSRTERKAA